MGVVVVAGQIITVAVSCVWLERNRSDEGGSGGCCRLRLWWPEEPEKMKPVNSVGGGDADEHRGGDDI